MSKGERNMPRCVWAGPQPHMRRYHDREWGKPVHDDRRLFEMLLLEGAQAGLSWETDLSVADLLDQRDRKYRRIGAVTGLDPSVN